jgi:hypothetical protein
MSGLPKIGRAPAAILALFVLALGAAPSAPAQAIPYTRPVETAPQQDAIGGGYRTSAVQRPLPCDYWL